MNAIAVYLGISLVLPCLGVGGISANCPQSMRDRHADSLLPAFAMVVGFWPAVMLLPLPRGETCTEEKR